LGDPLADVHDQPGDRDLGRTDRLAGIAGDAQALRPGSVLQPVVHGRHDQPDRAGVDVAEEVAADDLVGRADVRAGPAADTLQRLAQFRVLTRRPAAVV